jgi:hypothetical protein
MAPTVLVTKKTTPALTAWEARGLRAFKRWVTARYDGKDGVGTRLTQTVAEGMGKLVAQAYVDGYRAGVGAAWRDAERAAMAIDPVAARLVEWGPAHAAADPDGP